MNLAKKAVSGVIWNSVAKFSSYGIEFAIGIILARVLTPTDFGLVGSLIIIIAISEVLINSGFSQALIQKKRCTDGDYSTVFWFNLSISVALAVILFFSADPISLFLNNKQLIPLIQVLGVTLIFSSFSIIQRTILAKNIDFKLLTKVNLFSSLVSGLISITLALNGFGVWSLVLKTLIYRALESVLLWFYTRWRPMFLFDESSFKSMFGFGSKLLFSGMIDTLFKNINYFVIAKFFTSQDLGFYTRAEMFKNLPSQNVTSIITTVAFPVLSTLQDSQEKMGEAFKKLFSTTFYIISLLMLCLIAISNPLIISLLGEKWERSIVLLQLLSVVGLFYPLNSLNINILNVVGRSDLYLQLQVYSQLLNIPTVGIGIFFGIKSMIISMIFSSLLSYIMFSVRSSTFTGYGVGQQIRGIFGNFLVSTIIASTLFFFDLLTELSPLLTLSFQIGFGFILVIITGEVFNIKEYLFIKETIKNKTNRR